MNMALLPTTFGRAIAITFLSFLIALAIVLGIVVVVMVMAQILGASLA